MRPRTRGRLLTVLVAIAAAVVVVLVGLIGAGYLRLPTSPAPTVTISAVHWHILEGTTAGGIGWFGNSTFNYTTGNGYPQTVRSGGSISIPWTTSNFDSANHTVYSVTTSAPFAFEGSRPALPMVAPGGEDDVIFEFTIAIPSGTSGSFALDLTVNALS